MTAPTASADPARRERTFFGHPRILGTLFLTEMWERFSYYGMRAILVLYLTTSVVGPNPPGGGLGFSTGEAAAIYGTYSALVYIAPLAGGWIADRVLCPRKVVLVGGIIIACGHYLMAAAGLTQAFFWLGLLSIALGTGLFKPNTYPMVSQLYGEHDRRRDAGFSIFYMGVNVGSFFSPFVVGWLADDYGWHWGFGAAGVGMTIGLIQYVIGYRKFGEIGAHVHRPADRSIRIRAVGVAIGIVLIVAILVTLDLTLWDSNLSIITTTLAVVIVIAPVVYFWRIFRSPDVVGIHRDRMKALIYLFIGVVMFWAIADQAGSTLNVFAQEDTDRAIGDYVVPAAFFQSLNPIYIIMLAPVFAFVWQRLADRAPTTPGKFFLAQVGVGISMLMMIPPAMGAASGQLASVWWLVTMYFVQTVAELLLNPTGQSAATKLAPKGRVSQVMALWLMGTAVADAIGGQLAALIIDQSMAVFFGVLGVAALVVSVMFLVMGKHINRLMSGVR
ncbi:MAG: peptide MFS transporter [Candidatus Nanopelagicales bacterium]|nr:peptide MFS transporter [Candidatus Nanopelagicales bacterium]